MLTLSPTTRISITLPVDTVHQLDYVSRRLGCSRSSVCSFFLGSSMGLAMEVVDSQFVVPAGTKVRRSSGRSAEELASIFDALVEEMEQIELQREVQHELFPDAL